MGNKTIQRAKFSTLRVYIPTGANNRQKQANIFFNATNSNGNKRKQTTVSSEFTVKCKGLVLSPGPLICVWTPHVRWCGRSGDRSQSHLQQLEVSEHLLAKLPSKSKHNELEVFRAVLASRCILWHCRSLSSEHSIYALSCLIVQLQQGFLRHVGSDFILLHIINCSGFFYCAQSYPIL